MNHFKGYTWEELVFYGMDFHYTALGWTELSWEGIDSPPTSSAKLWDQLTETEREHAADVCYYASTWDGLDMSPNDGSFPFAKPKMRYVPWTQLSGEDQSRAGDSLLYTETTWNEYGTADIEAKSWGELSEKQQIDALEFGFYEKTWDCFQNHYESKEWNEIDRSGQDALNVLGWNEETWDLGKQPNSYKIMWQRLSKTEATAAAVLCYFADNWVGGSLLPPASQGSTYTPGGSNGGVGGSGFSSDGSTDGSQRGSADMKNIATSLVSIAVFSCAQLLL
jgi:hypothetical protein